MRRLALVVIAACGQQAAGTSPDAALDAAPQKPTSSVTLETARNTSASPLFRDDYTNYNTSAQTGNGNGDLVPRAISKVPIGTLVPGAHHVFVETQTWFCHLPENEAVAGGALVANARCGSHIDVGYNSDDPAQVTLQVTDLLSRGVDGSVMDWTGGATDISTNAISAWRDAAEATRGAFQFVVMEDEGITKCRRRADCNVTSQVIDDLQYIAKNWASSPAYVKEDGKPVVAFFAPDYNACPSPTAADCQHIDWDAVRRAVPDQVWIFENKGGFSHAYTGGAFSWLSTTLYPGSDPSFGTNYLADYDRTAAAASGHVFASAFKGFDDGVTDGWNFGDGSHTRYIEQRCGKTWLESLARVAHDLPDVEFLELVTWDDYEEATELETGIDTCLSSIDVALDGSHLSWSVTYGSDLTGGATGSEDTIDHFVVWSSPDGDALVHIADVPAGTHALDLDAVPDGSIYVEAVGKPFLANALSAGLSTRR